MKNTRPRLRAFSLIELLVAMSILSAMLLMFVGVLDGTRLSWESAQARVSQFREARTAFDIITKNMSQATLNAYYDQVDEDGNAVPDDYEITSELHFKVMQAEDLRIRGDKPGHALFFQAPLGVVDDPRFNAMSNLLNARGYYVLFGSDKEFTPPFISSSYEERFRYRLMEFLPPTEQNLVYIDHQEDINNDRDDPKFDRWYNDRALLEDYSRPLAENIVAIIFSPREPTADVTGSPDLDERRAVERIAPYYEFDSEIGEAGSGQKKFKHTLPPLVKVTMIAIDEGSAIRMAQVEGDQEYAQRIFGIGSGWMDNASSYSADIEDFMDTVSDINLDEDSGYNINYKIFSTTVSILSSKWSVADQIPTP